MMYCSGKFVTKILTFYIFHRKETITNYKFIFSNTIIGGNNICHLLTELRPMRYRIKPILFDPLSPGFHLIIMNFAKKLPILGSSN